MPKKFVGENSKSAVARARKEAVKEEKQVQKQKELEDAYWKDDDKHVVKKQQRKDDKDKKKQEQLEKKVATKKLLEEEMNSIKPNKAEPSKKLTRDQIISQLERTKSPENVAPKTSQEEPIVENLNRVVVEGEEARTIDEALTILTDKTKEIDLHPEKRLKAAFAAFEAENMERLKKEHPTLRLSQLKQLLRKEWMKSPANPLNNL